MSDSRDIRLSRLLTLCTDAANAASDPDEERRLHERWCRVLDAAVDRMLDEERQAELDTESAVTS